MCAHVLHGPEGGEEGGVLDVMWGHEVVGESDKSLG